MSRELEKRAADWLDNRPGWSASNIDRVMTDFAAQEITKAVAEAIAAERARVWEAIAEVREMPCGNAFNSSPAYKCECHGYALDTLRAKLEPNTTATMADSTEK